MCILRAFSKTAPTPQAGVPRDEQTPWDKRALPFERNLASVARWVTEKSEKPGSPVRPGRRAAARDVTDRPCVSQGLVSRAAKLTFISPLKCFNAVSFTGTQKRVLGVVSFTPMAFIHLLSAVHTVLFKAQFAIIHWQYSRRVSGANTCRRTDDF